MLTKEQALDKVRKLLALSESSNENEAATAAARAASIMAEYRLDSAMLGAQAEEAREAFKINVDPDALGARTTRHYVPWYWRLAWSVAEANNCLPWYVYENRMRRVAFVGRRSDALACRYMLDAISNDVDQLAAAFVRKSGTRVVGNSFRLGCVRTIASRLSAVAQETAAAKSRELAGDTVALVKLDGALVRLREDAQQLREWNAKTNGEYSKAKPVKISSGDAYRAGQEAGKTVRLTGGAAALGGGARALKKGA